MALYRNERIPEHSFVMKLKKVDPNLFVVFDSFSMRWDILYKSHVDSLVHQVYRVCKRDDDSKDAGYEPLDDRVIDKLLRMDLRRRNMSSKEYCASVGRATDMNEAERERKDKEVSDYIYKHEKRTIDAAYEAAKNINWSE